MKDSYSKKESIQILARALTEKEQETNNQARDLNFNDLEILADEFGVSTSDLKKAVVETTETKEHKRDELYPEIVSARWVEGRLSKQEIEEFFAELKVELGESKTWYGQPAKIHKLGRIWEYQLNDASILLRDTEDGYQLHVIKHQFFHGNHVEASLLAIPVAFILGFLPVAATAEWLSIFGAVLVASVIYAASFTFVKKFTQRIRSNTASKLLQITEFAETKLQNLTDTSQVHSETIQIDHELDNPSTEKSSSNKKTRA